jgi:hypothetical protein
MAKTTLRVSRRPRRFRGNPSWRPTLRDLMIAILANLVTAGLTALTAVGASLFGILL